MECERLPTPIINHSTHWIKCCHISFLFDKFARGTLFLSYVKIWNIFQGKRILIYLSGSLDIEKQFKNFV